jgi:hypothetical protein
MARDKFHKEVREALEKEGWAITDDPLYVKIGQIPMHIDLGAEKLIGAEKEGEKIAIEIKTFGNSSFITAMHEAVGKYIIYREALAIINSNRSLYLAMPNDLYEYYKDELLIERIFSMYKFKIIVYESNNQSIISWIN